MKHSEDKVLAKMRSVGVRRHDRWIVRDIDLTIRRGEIVSIIGPNGAGKTTITRILTDTVKPNTGTIEKMQGIKIGYVPQRVVFDSTLPITVERLMNVPKRVSKRDVDEALGELGICHLAKSPVQKLSGGEFQRALFARALLRKPDLLILDEPGQGLDIHGESRLYEQIAMVRNRRGCGVLLVCHDLHIVMAQTDIVVCINGHICCTGSPEDVQSNEAYLDLFGKRALRTHAPYAHSHDHGHD